MTSQAEALHVTPLPVEALTYGQAPRSVAGRLWGAAVLVMAALGLIALGGCFLIGVMMMVTGAGFGPGPVSIHGSLGVSAFIVVLYAVAFACFGGGVVILVMAVKAVVRVMQ